MKIGVKQSVMAKLDVKQSVMAKLDVKQSVMAKIDVKQSVMEANNELAAKLRAHWAERRALTLNMISSPGSGKTALLEKTLLRLRDRLKIGILVGDVQTENDAKRLAVYGSPVKQIITSGTCHLEAHMIEKHLPFVEQGDLDVLIIENVGNLICPSSYDLGEDFKVVLLSTTEGEDKPLKYPGIFRRAQVAMITKIDLLPYTDFDLDLAERNIRSIHNETDILALSSRTGEGFDRWLDWLQQRVQEKRSLGAAEKGPEFS